MRKNRASLRQDAKNLSESKGPVRLVGMGKFPPVK